MTFLAGEKKKLEMQMKLGRAKRNHRAVGEVVAFE